MGFYLRRPAKIPTVEKVDEELMDIPGFPKMCGETLRKWLHKLGFSCRRRNRKYKVYESLDVIALRHRYLQDIRKYRSNGFKFFYQAETWCNSHHTLEFVWLLEESARSKFWGVVRVGG